MSFKSNLKLDSPIFNRETRNNAFGSAAYKSAQEFRADLKEKMIASIPAGRTVSIGEGKGFDTRFKRSRRGQRPAIQTGRLLNSYRAKKTGDTSAETSVIAETDEGFDYGQELQSALGRAVMTTEDVEAAEKNYNANLSRSLIGLLK